MQAGDLLVERLREAMDARGGPLVVLAPEHRPRQETAAGAQVLEPELQALLAAVNAEVESYERLAFLTVLRDEWTIDNGMLTPTLKVKRARIEDAYRAQEAGWYEQGRKAVIDSGAG